MLDSQDTVLYVGVSFNIINRMRQHFRDSEWFFRVAMIRIDWYETLEIARTVERDWIMTHNPPWNIAHSASPMIDSMKIKESDWQGTTPEQHSMLVDLDSLAELLDAFEIGDHGYKATHDHLKRLILQAWDLDIPPKVIAYRTRRRGA